ncbi:MAG: hypothetical protein L6R40_003015 [Gallowayella cf. fulva]|nr:MAG: hypothetical protein L6R40_003015 [Xanthomendoza cf. fulva]
MKLLYLTVPLFASLVGAHFTLDFPQVRGFDEDNLGTFPCGGQNSVSNTRTPWPLDGGSIQLTMEHDHAAVQVLVALGNDPSSNFNAVLVPTTQEEGIGQFCLSGVKVPQSLGVKDGDNATIQVVTNGDPSGGLYNCADITFSSTNSSASTSKCTNGRGIRTTQYSGKANANGTDATTPTTTASGTGAASPTASSAQTSPSSMRLKMRIVLIKQEH